MKRRPRPLAILALLLLAVPVAAKKQKPEDKKEDKPGLPTLAEKTEGFERREGFLTVYLDREGGKVWLEVPPPAGEHQVAAETLYVEGLVTGLGSNPVGLDRGQIGEDTRLLAIRRLGPRVLFEEQNLRYRALSEDEAERRAARESFATSVVWGQEIAALDPDGRALVDLTPFVVRDAHGVAATLRRSGQGSYALDPARSAFDPEAALVFPDNVELEAILTFTTSGDPGDEVAATAPDPEAVTLIQHHSFLRLPAPGYAPRPFDPRAGVHSIAVHDYAAALDQPIVHRLITRHRLRAGEPLTFYVDPGAPEPVRGALLDGARWWAEAFAAAGHPEGYRVALLPAGVHPLDARYHVIQWVHRATRGWSYGGGVIDPRTGEIVKGYVTLGSLRVRQDRLLFEGLAGTAKTGSGAPDDPIELALARIRQLAAHEVGHALGLAHNFAASTYDGRASVMDYPAPLVAITSGGELDFSGAYGVGVGTWDVQAIRYAYAEPPPGTSEAEFLDGIVRDGLAAGRIFLADSDARPAGAADPRASLWDNGADAVDALAHALRVREIALARFGEQNLAPGRPLAELQEVLAPVYFHHRYQLDAAVKTIGGLEIAHALRGDGQTPLRPIPAADQRRALDVILGILEPERLDLPDRVLALLGPRPFESDRNREMFAATTEPAFDALGAAATAADQVVTALLEPARLGRLVDFHRRDPEQPGIEAVLAKLVAKAFTEPSGEPRHDALRHAVRRVVVDRLIDLAASHDVAPPVRAHAEATLRAIRARLGAPAPERPYDSALAADVARFLDRTYDDPRPLRRPDPPPPGSPIGAAAPGADR